MPPFRDIFLDFLLPALIAAAAFALAWHRNRNGRWIAPLALSAAFALAYIGIGGAPRWPPGSGDASYSLIWFTIPTALLGCLDALFRPPLWARAMLLFIFLAAAIHTLAAPLAPAATSPLFIALPAAAAVISWESWETLASRRPGIFTPFLLGLTLAVAAAALGLSNNIKPSQGVVAMGGTVLAVLAVAWRWPATSLDRGAILAWLVPLYGLFLFVHLYSYTEPPPAVVALILLAPLPARWLPATRRPRTLQLAALALLLAAALGLSVRQFLQSPADSAPQDRPSDDY